jgi:hypothetical protein
MQNIFYILNQQFHTLNKNKNRRSCGNKKILFLDKLSKHLVFFFFFLSETQAFFTKAIDGFLAHMEIGKGSIIFLIEKLFGSF